MKQLQTVPALASDLLVDKLVQEFASAFPELELKDTAFGRCKFISYELCCYLRRRNIPAVLIHVEGAKDGAWPNAHKTWQEKPRVEWSHYVAAVNDVAYDLSARQFDSKLPYPYKCPVSKLSAEWSTVEADEFLNSLVMDVFPLKDFTF